MSSLRDDDPAFQPSGTAEQLIGAASPGQHIRAVAAVQDVIPESTGEHVGTAKTAQLVIPR